MGEGPNTGSVEPVRDNKPFPSLSQCKSPNFMLQKISENLEAGTAPLASHTQKHYREIERAIGPLLARHGATGTIEPNDPHAHLVVCWRGLKRFTPVSSSPRDGDVAVKKKLSDVRRLLRDMGAPA